MLHETPIPPVNRAKRFCSNNQPSREFDSNLTIAILFTRSVAGKMILSDMNF